MYRKVAKLAGISVRRKSSNPPSSKMWVSSTWIVVISWRPKCIFGARQLALLASDKTISNSCQIDRALSAAKWLKSRAGTIRCSRKRKRKLTWMRVSHYFGRRPSRIWPVQWLRKSKIRRHSLPSTRSLWRRRRSPRRRFPAWRRVASRCSRTWRKKNNAASRTASTTC